MGVVSWDQGQAQALEAQNRPHYPASHGETVIPLYTLESWGPFWREGIPCLPLGALPRANVTLFMEEGQGQTPGQVWPSLGLTS